VGLLNDLRNVHASQLNVQCSSVSSRHVAVDGCQLLCWTRRTKVYYYYCYITAYHKTRIISKNTARNWHRHDEHGLQLPASLHRRARPSFTRPEKQSISSAFHLSRNHGSLIISAMHNTWFGPRHFFSRKSFSSNANTMPKPSHGKAQPTGATRCAGTIRLILTSHVLSLSDACYPPSLPTLHSTA
jgi:hypothetical protein